MLASENICFDVVHLVGAMMLALELGCCGFWIYHSFFVCFLRFWPVSSLLGCDMSQVPHGSQGRPRVSQFFFLFLFLKEV